MKRSIMTLALLAAFSGQALAVDVVNHKTPYCGCCTEWTKHMEKMVLRSKRSFMKI